LQDHHIHSEMVSRKKNNNNKGRDIDLTYGNELDQGCDVLLQTHVSDRLSSNQGSKQEKRREEMSKREGKLFQLKKVTGVYEFLNKNVH